MKQKRVVIIITIVLVIGAVVAGTSVLSLIQAKTQGTITGKNIQPTEIKPDNQGLATTHKRNTDSGNATVLRPNVFFDVQH